MKITKNLKAAIVNETRHYQKKMGINKLPDLVLEVIPMDGKNTKQWGHYYMPKCKIGGMIYLNIEKHKTKIELSYTIVHELTHVKHPRLEHGKKFESIVERYLEHES